MASPRRRSAPAIPLSILLPLAAAAFLLASYPSPAHSRRLTGARPSDTTPLLLSDGAGTAPRFPSPYLQLPTRLAAAAEQCEQTYGVMPCTTTVVGNLFLLLVYGFLMFQAAKYLSTGSEMLLEILGPGIVGGLFLPILGALPDAILIFVSGVSGTKEEAQGQVLIGMGLLAGSTVMLVTVLWGSCVVVGSTELVAGRASEDSSGEARKLSLFGSGISTDVLTSYAARIMVISVIPFIIMQLPKIFKSPTWTKATVPVSLVLAVVFLLSYCAYQIYQPWIQKRRLAFAKLKHVVSGILKHVHNKGLSRLVHEDGTPNIEDIKMLFKKIDRDGSGSISRDELYALIVGIQFDVADLDHDDAVNLVLNDFDTDHNRSIEEHEFIDGIRRFILAHRNGSPAIDSSKDFIHGFHDRTRIEYDMLAEEGEEEMEGAEFSAWIILTAVFYLILGTIIAVLFADPLVDAVDNFSDATHIPSFFISFIAMPLATNSSEAVSALIFASRKKLKTSSLTFSEIYGAVTMNNTLCLAVFLSLVYLRGLTWDFSSEVLIILIVCVIMGLFASFRTTFPLWTSIVAYALYPFSLALVYILDYKFGWS